MFAATCQQPPEAPEVEVISIQLLSQAYLYQTNWQNSIIRSLLSLSSSTHIQAQILRSLFPKRFFASLELSFHQSQVIFSTNSYTILFITSSIQHTVSFTQSVPLPSQNTPILSFIPPLNSPRSSPIYGFQSISSASLVTRVSTREYTNTIGFTGAI